MGVDEHRSKAPKSVTFAVVTVSDTRTAADDSSGDAIVQLMNSSGHSLVERTIVRDEVSEIQKALRLLLESDRAQVIVVNGGTGITKRDVTLEATAHFQEKPIPGFGELFRSLSFKEIGPAAMISRASAFVCEGKVVFCLPGSEKAVRLAVKELIAPEVSHLVWEASR